MLHYTAAAHCYLVSLVVREQCLFQGDSQQCTSWRNLRLTHCLYILIFHCPFYLYICAQLGHQLHLSIAAARRFFRRVCLNGFKIPREYSKKEGVRLRKSRRRRCSSTVHVYPTVAYKIRPESSTIGNNN